MPYDVKRPPAKTRTLTRKGRRQWVHVMNRSLAAGDSEAAAHRKAWGAVRNSGNRKEASTKDRVVSMLKVAAVVRLCKRADNGVSGLVAASGARGAQPQPAAWTPEMRVWEQSRLSNGAWRGAGWKDTAPAINDVNAPLNGLTSAVDHKEWSPEPKPAQATWLQQLAKMLPALLTGAGGLYGVHEFLRGDTEDERRYGRSSALLRYLPALLGIGGGLAMRHYQKPGPLNDFIDSVRERFPSPNYGAQAGAINPTTPLPGSHAAMNDMGARGPYALS